MNPVEASKEFIRGFSHVTGLSEPEAVEQWGWFSRQLTDSDRQAVEEVGYDNGVKEGESFKKMYMMR